MALMTQCRACLAPHPHLFLALGDHPPANSFVRPGEQFRELPTYALDAQACLECGLIAVADQIPADFFEHYLYVPSSASSMHVHFAGLASVLKDIAKGGQIVDIGCNDGLLLSACNAMGCNTVGIDPAANLAEIARTRGVRVEVGYFTSGSAGPIRDRIGRASVIVTTNTFNHIGDLHDFMAGVRTLLADDGCFVVEVPWSKDLLEKNEFDTIYHEHVSEFSLLSLKKLGAFFDLDIVDVHRLDIHGGSMRVFMRDKRSGAERAPIVDSMLAEELEAGILSAATYEDFADRVKGVGTELAAMLKGFNEKGLKVAGYGAPAKGNTLLNYFGIGPDKLEYLVDRNALKQGLLSPGMHIPIRSPDAIVTDAPDVLLVLAWNFFDEIKEQQKEFIERGGRFLVPLPTPTIVGAN